MTRRRRWNTSPGLSAFTMTRDHPYRCEPLAVLAALFDQLGHHESAATIADSQTARSRGRVPELTTAIIHLRKVLGDETYESFARRGEDMTTAAIVTYAYDQIDQARAELNAVSK